MAPNPTSAAGGGGRIRTYEGISQQIYSLPPLAAWVPLPKMSRVFCGARHDVSMQSRGQTPKRPNSLVRIFLCIDIILRYIYLKICHKTYRETYASSFLSFYWAASRPSRFRPLWARLHGGRRYGRPRFWYGAKALI